MTIGFAGAGKVGTCLGAYFISKGARVSGYYSRTPDSARESARFTDTEYFSSPAEAAAASDIIMITTSDSSIASVWRELTKMDDPPSGGLLSGKIVCHCSGALSSEVFEGARDRGVSACSLHPLLAFPEKFSVPPGLPEAVFCAEGDEGSVSPLNELMKACGNRLRWIKSEDKIRYHAAAVFASNLAVGLYDCAFGIMESVGFPEKDARDALGTLITANAARVVQEGAAGALTGPIERNDPGTIQKHLSSLDRRESAIYKTLSDRIISIAETRHPDRDYSLIRELTGDYSNEKHCIDPSENEERR